MRYIHIFYIFIIAIVWFTPFEAKAQSEYTSTEEMAIGAQQLFEQERYIQAFPLYAQLLSLDPSNPELNYRFGVCLLYSDRSDTYAPISYLKKAINQISDPELYYHLGLAYHINYYFPGAISYYKEYQTRAGKKAKESFDVARKIEMCQNGMKMMRSVKDLFVLQKSKVPRNEFYRSYDLHDFGARIISKPEAFVNKEDQKQNKKDFVFFNPKANAIYYSAYSKGNKNQKDIFRRYKLPEGEWSKAEKLSVVINTIYDEDFPVIMPDGKTLYFSSKGHTTIGGYDIFKSVFNAQTQEWSMPENINFPFNTPVDDILFVSDTSESTAWFASERNSVADKIMVYKVGIIKRPEGSIDLAEIYAKNQELTEDDMRRIKERARLDVNITSDEYEEIPVSEDPAITEQRIIDENNEMLAIALAKKKQEQQIIDSAKNIIVQLEANVDAFDKVRQEAVGLASSNRVTAHRLREEVKTHIALVASATEVSTLQKVIEQSNVSMGKAERLEYEAAELDVFAQHTKEQIDELRTAFVELNQQYGDAEAAVIYGDADKARSIITQMDTKTQQIPNLPDLSAKFDVNAGGLSNIQYPQNLENLNTYTAFVISSSDGSEPQIESFSAAYEEYIPKKESGIAEVSGESYSNNPSVKVDEYIKVLNQNAQSLDIQITERQSEIDQIIIGFDQLSNDEKEDQLNYLNATLQEQDNDENNADFIRQTAVDLKEDRQQQILSSADPEEKMLVYQQLVATAETVFDFNKKALVSSTATAITPIAAVTVYQIASNGKLTESPPEKVELTPSFQMSFNEESSQQIQTQATQMMSQTRTDSKQNGFAIQKVEHRIDLVKQEAREAFSRAESLMTTAKSANANRKAELISQANILFNEAGVKTREVAEMELVLQEMQTAEVDSKNIVQALLDKNEELNTAIKDKDWDKVNSSYLEIERDYNNHHVIVDFSDRVDTQSGELVATKPSTDEAFLAYQISPSGVIIKAYGDANADWESYESFSNDVTNQNEDRNLVLSPNFNRGSTQENLVSIFAPAPAFNGEDIAISTIVLPATINNSSYSLVNNTVAQIENLKAETEVLVRKRNSINTYYQESLVEAANLEAQSLQLLQGSSLSNDIIDQANQLSSESKKVLWKAATAAALIQRFDEGIVLHTALIAESVEVAEQIEEYYNANNQDEALLLNVQLQRKASNLSAQNIDDSQFNYAVSEIFVTPPDIFDQEENQEYVLSNGQVQRNDQANLNQLFYQNSPNIKVDFSANAFIIPASLAVANNISDRQATTETASSTPIVSNETNPSVTSATETPNSNLASSQQENIPEQINVQSYQAEQFNEPEDFRVALSELNTFSQHHISGIIVVGDALIILAEQKLKLSNDKSLEAESISDPTQKQAAHDLSKQYLYEAMAIKSIAENYQVYSSTELSKQENITETTFQIESSLGANQLDEGKALFVEMQNNVQQFGATATTELATIQLEMKNNLSQLNRSMDSAYAVSQSLANESVRLLSEASEERDQAEGKRNAFKRRELLKVAEDLEIQATDLQNQSEKALSLGNDLYQKTQVALALSAIMTDLNQIIDGSQPATSLIAKQSFVFEGIDNRKEEVLEGKLNTTAQLTPVSGNSVSVAVTDDLHVYKRETFKAEMISEELELITREIALLVTADKTNMSERELFVLDNQVKQLREKSDSLEYEANKAFEFANRILNTLSAEDQKEAKDKGHDFNDYLQDLKDKIEILLSEASSYKQRAQRSNNIVTREELYNKAKEKEEVAMYLILEEFEVIAQKNKTRYRKNQLILQQMLVESASPQERELMLNIFSQIDSYFDQAEEKRRKANKAGVSFNMRKILLQDAYSLEMKALDMQLQAQKMLQNNDAGAMLALQLVADDRKESSVAQNTQGNNNQVQVVVDVNESGANTNQNTVVNTSTTATQPADQAIVFDSPTQGNIYKVQFSALREIKSMNFFPSIPEITAERVSNSDFIRYFSGSFSNIDAAMIRRNSIRASGYPDAFIKSWKNGESISLLSMRENADNASVNLNASSTSQAVVNNIDFSATNISSLSGVYYTVQVGVYSRPRTSAMIHGIAPLYHKRLKNGYWVYYSGIFKTIADATLKKDEIVIKGVSDAFIVAFSDGQSVSFATARQDLSRGGNEPQEEDIVILEDASLQIESQWNIAQAGTSNADSDGLSMRYKIQVGVYSNQINLDWVSSQLDNGLSLDSFQNDNGKYVYIVGDFSTKEAALAHLNSVKELVSDAFIVGFRGGRKIYVR